jgi:hypothetical protein
MTNEAETSSLSCCLWTNDDDGDPEKVWETSCGNAFSLAFDTPSDHGIKFCCFCGKSLKQNVRAMRRADA